MQGNYLKKEKIGVGAGHVALLRPHSTGGVGVGGTQLRSSVCRWCLMGALPVR